MLRRIITSLIAMLLALSVAAPAASAQGSPKYFYVCFGGTVTVSLADENVLRCSWGAKTEGQMRMFLNGDVISFELKDGTGNVVWTLDPEDAATHWSDLFEYKASDFGFECKPDVGWASLLRLPLGTLEAGTYTLTINETYLHPVNDGLQACSMDGERFPAPSLYPAGPLPTVVTTIVVS